MDWRIFEVGKNITTYSVANNGVPHLSAKYPKNPFRRLKMVFSYVFHFSERSDEEAPRH